MILPEPTPSATDLELGYPRMREIYSGMHQVYIEYFTKHLESAHSEKNVKRLLESFFGLGEDSVVHSSALALTGALLDKLTSFGESVLTLEPTWPLYDVMIRNLGDGGRLPLHTNDITINEARKAYQDSARPVKVMIVNIPRNPDMFVPDDNYLSELARFADENNITVLYDEVFCVFADQTQIKREGQENTIVFNYPRAKKHFIVRDTGKVLPEEQYGKLALGHPSEALSEDASYQAFIESFNVLNYHTNPPQISALASLLHHVHFPNLIDQIKELANANFSQIQAILSSYSSNITQHGPFALVELNDLNLSVVKSLQKQIGIFSSVEYFFWEQDRIYLRIPLLREQVKLVSDLEELFQAYKEALIKDKGNKQPNHRYQDELASNF